MKGPTGPNGNPKYVFTANPMHGKDLKAKSRLRKHIERRQDKHIKKKRNQKRSGGTKQKQSPRKWSKMKNQKRKKGKKPSRKARKRGEKFAGGRCGITQRKPESGKLGGRKRKNAAKWGGG